MKIYLLIAATALILAPVAWAQDALRVDHNTREPIGPLNLSGANVSGSAFDPAGAATAVAAAAPKLPPTPLIGANWVYSSFNDIGSPNETLSLSYSQDGVSWTSTTPNYSAPAGNGVRDPSITQINGVYYVAYTAGNFGQANYFQICKSTDLVNWTYLCNVNTTAAGLGGYTWAPEWFIDRDGSVYIYYCRPNAGGVWLLFCVKAASLDLTQWSAPQNVGLANYGAIDPQVVRDGDTYYLSYRAYNYGDYVQIATGTSPTSFNSAFKTGNFAGWGTPREGPSLVHLGGLRWRMYFDFVGSTLNGSVVAYSDSFDGLNTWSAPAAAVGIPSHGTCLALNENAGAKNSVTAITQAAADVRYVQPNTSPTFTGTTLNGGNLKLTGSSVGGASSGSGFVLALGYNGSNNKQLWLGDPDYLGNAAGGFFRVLVLSGGVVVDGVNGTNAAIVPIKTDTIWSFGAGLTSAGTTYANRAASPAIGTQQMFTDSTTQTWGATIGGGGSLPALGLWDGANWTVIGK